MNIEDRIRELSKKATQGRWSAHDSGGICVAKEDGTHALPPIRQVHQGTRDDANLIVFLRNHAEEIADVLEAARAVRDARRHGVAGSLREMDVWPQFIEAIAALDRSAEGEKV